MLRQEKGITLVALIVTIIILIILAGVSIGAIAGDRSILSQSRDASAMSTYNGINEQANIAFEGIRTKIMIESAKDSSYDATKAVELNKFAEMIKNDCPSDKGYTYGVDMTTASSPIFYIKYSDSGIKQASIAEASGTGDTATPAKPQYNGEINIKFTVGQQTISYQYDIAKPADTVVFKKTIDEITAPAPTPGA